MTNMQKLLTATLLGVGTVVQATDYTYDFNWNATLAIPDGSPVGLTHDFTVSGATEGSILDVQVTLDISGGFNGDLYAYLVSPQGTTSILLNRLGMTSGNILGYSDTGLNITLGGLATDDVHLYQNYSPTMGLNGRLTGTWAADGRDIAPNSLPLAFDSAAVTAGLGQYAGSDANGTWTLLIADLNGGNAATLNQAILTIITVPEPQTWAMLAGGLATLMVFCKRRTAR